MDGLRAEDRLGREGRLVSSISALDLESTWRRHSWLGRSRWLVHRHDASGDHLRAFGRGEEQLAAWRAQAGWLLAGVGVVGSSFTRNTGVVVERRMLWRAFLLGLHGNLRPVLEDFLDAHLRRTGGRFQGKGLLGLVLVDACPPAGLVALEELRILLDALAHGRENEPLICGQLGLGAPSARPGSIGVLSFACVWDVD